MYTNLKDPLMGLSKKQDITPYFDERLNRFNF